MKTTKDKKQKGVEIASRIIREIKGLCQGIHIMPLGWAKQVPQIIEQAEL